MGNDKIDNINRKGIVSSEDTRDIFDQLLNDSIDNYHFLTQLKGLINSLVACVELTNTGSLTIVASTTKSELNSVIFNAYSPPIYPSTIADKDDMKAERSTEYVSIFCKRLSSRSSFTDSMGNLYSTIKLNRVTLIESGVKAPDAIKETDIDSIFKDGIPYIVRYEYTTSTPTKAILQIDLESTGEPILMNALRWIPMPAAGSVLLKSITYNGGKLFKMNGGKTIDAITNYSVERSTQGYLHFEPVEMSSLRLILESEVYISSLQCLSLGISRMIGELNTYAKKSYIGYVLDFPEDYNTLTGIEIVPAGYSKSSDNVRIKIYNNIDDFNNMNNKYLISGSTSFSSNISITTGSRLYVLTELESVNNTTPSISQLKFTFSNL